MYFSVFLRMRYFRRRPKYLKNSKSFFHEIFTVFSFQ